MKFIRMTIISVLLLLTVLTGRNSFARDLTFDNMQVLAVVPVTKGSIDQNVYKRFDRLVPELKKISRNSVVVLECRYSGKPEREQDVVKAYQLAGRIEKYMRERHKLDLNIWITVSLSQIKTRTVPVLAISVVADNLRRLDSIPVVPSPDILQSALVR